MKSEKQKRKEIKLSRAKAKAEEEYLKLLEGLKNRTIIVANSASTFSYHMYPSVPTYYRDTVFICKGCGVEDLWTAVQQQRWYEVQGGEIESIAINCRACRREERVRKEIARKISIGGKARKKNANAKLNAKSSEQRALHNTTQTPENDSWA